MTTGRPFEGEILTPKRGKRPALVWAIFVVTLVITAIMATGISLILSGSPLLTEQDRADAGDLFTFQGITGLITAALNLAAAIALFALRRVAVRLYTAGLAVGTISWVAEIVSPLQPLSARTVPQVAVGLGVPILLLLYSRSLARTGVLR